jgi:hypothetical protein
MFLIAKDENRERMRGMVQLWLGIAFFVAGLVSFAFNQTADSSVWVNVISIVFAAGGILMVVRSLLHKESRIFSR